MSANGIDGAFDLLQPLVLVVAGAGKAIFIALVLTKEARYPANQAGVAVVIDSLLVAVFACYLLASKRVSGLTGTAKRPFGWWTKVYQ